MKRSLPKNLDSLPRSPAVFVTPMECLPVSKLPKAGEPWIWELKLDGFRTLAVKPSDASARKVTLYSRNLKLLNERFPQVEQALNGLPHGTVVDGEIVALDDKGRPDFNLLQNFRSAASRIRYCIFDLLWWKDRDLKQLPLIERRDLANSLLSFPDKRIIIVPYFEVADDVLLASAKEQGLEGIVGKQRDSVYEPGQKTGAWIKYRINLGQELVVGGYVPGPHGLDSLIVGYYRGNDLIYVARVRNGFVPASRRTVFARLRPLVTANCPFVNLPETRPSRWGEGLTAEGMKKCVWIQPELVAQIEFREWTQGDHLRHSTFKGLREDKDPRTVTKEEPSELL